MTILAGLSGAIAEAWIGYPDVCAHTYTPGCQSAIAVAGLSHHAASICAHAKPMRLVSAVIIRYQM